ncbi:MAG: hypothetical protein E7560_00400 [Ruminococcaceae bacterium]|nr:hypothetical protein [Oscillospiraceae bacterium]
MDTFFEQIVKIKADGKYFIKVAAIWILAVALCVFIFPLLGTFSVLACFGIIYLAYRLSSQLNIEYEYIITNGILDIDKIINKSSRKRELSIDLSKTTRIEKFSQSLISNVDKQKRVVACDEGDPNAYLLVCEREGKGTYYLVFAPDQKMQSAIVKFVPKFISNSAFK